MGDEEQYIDDEREGADELETGKQGGFLKDFLKQALKYVIIFLVAQFIGPVAMGLSFDVTGNYDSAYIIFIALAVGAAMTIISVKRPSVTTSE